MCPDPVSGTKSICLLGQLKAQKMTSILHAWVPCPRARFSNQVTLPVSSSPLQFLRLCSSAPGEMWIFIRQEGLSHQLWNCSLTTSNALSYVVFNLLLIIQNFKAKFQIKTNLCQHWFRMDFWKITLSFWAVPLQAAASSLVWCWAVCYELMQHILCF